MSESAYAADTVSAPAPALDPEAPRYWRSQAEDMKRSLDQLDVIEAAIPQLLGRLRTELYPGIPPGRRRVTR